MPRVMLLYNKSVNRIKRQKKLSHFCGNLYIIVLLIIVIVAVKFDLEKILY